MIPAGFEPTTHSLEGCCSIQLSYGTIAHKPLQAIATQKYINYFFYPKEMVFLRVISSLFHLHEWGVHHFGGVGAGLDELLVGVAEGAQVVVYCDNNLVSLCIGCQVIQLH